MFDLGAVSMIFAIMFHLLQVLAPCEARCSRKILGYEKSKTKFSSVFEEESFVRHLIMSAHDTIPVKI